MSMLASHVQIASLDYIDSAPQRQYATVKRPEAVCENALSPWGEADRGMYTIIDFTCHSE